MTWAIPGEASAQKIYWVDRGQIYRADLDGSNAEWIARSTYPIPKDIALDLDQEKIYWTDFIGYCIRRANLDGSSPETVIVTEPGRPLHVAVDVGSGSLYWIADGPLYTDNLYRANLDGSSTQLLGSDLHSSLLLGGTRGRPGTWQNLLGRGGYTRR